MKEIPHTYVVQDKTFLSCNDVPADIEASQRSEAGTSLIVLPLTFEQTLSDIRSASDDWAKSYISEENSAITLLGRIYAAVALVNNITRQELIREVKKHPDVLESKRWDPYDMNRSAEELYLTMILGLKKHRSRKSQWKTALLAAAEAGVSRREEAFIQWISAKKGIEGIQLSKRTSSSTEDPVADAIKMLHDMEVAGPPVESDVPVVPLSGDIGLTVYRRIEEIDDGRLSWVPIKFLCSDDFIVALRDTVLKAIKASETAAVRMVEDAERVFIKLLREKYRTWRRSSRSQTKGAPRNFDEWVDENESDYSDQKDESIALVPYREFRCVLNRTKTRQSKAA